MKTSQKFIQFVVGYIAAMFAASTMTVTIIMLMTMGHGLIDNNAGPSISALPFTLITGILFGAFVILKNESVSLPEHILQIQEWTPQMTIRQE